MEYLKPDCMYPFFVPIRKVFIWNQSGNPPNPLAPKPGLRGLIVFILVGCKTVKVKLECFHDAQ